MNLLNVGEDLRQSDVGGKPAALTRAWVIGPAGSGADIEIDDSTVQTRHALLGLDENARWWISAESGPVYLDGTQTTSAALDENSVIVVGKTAITVSSDLLAAGPAITPTSHHIGAALPALVDAPLPPSGREALAVELNHVTFAVAGKTLVDDVSFRIESGQMAAIVGPSGAGKSSLIKVLLGEYQHNAGEIRIGPPGTRPIGRPRREQIRYVPQSASDDLYPSLTVIETLTFAAQLRDTERNSQPAIDTPASPQSGVEQRVNKVIAQMGLENQRDSRVKILSGGERRRLSIGVELVGQPQLLILDEPTSGLDLGKDWGIMKALRQISRDLPCTIIVVTHSISHLVDYMDKVIVIGGGGGVRHDGPPPEPALADGGYIRWWAQWLVTLGKERRRPTTKSLPQRVRTPGAWRGGVSPAGFATALYRQILLVTRRGTKSLAALCALPLIGTLLAVISSDNGLKPSPNMTVQSILVTVAGLTGAALTYLDLVQERDVLRRDWRIGVSAACLLTSKITVFGGICFTMAGVMTLGFAWWRPLPPTAFGLPPIVVLFVVLFATMFASMALGMLISSASAKAEGAVALNTLLAVFQVVLNGAMFPLPGVFLQWLSALLPARLGFAALAGYVDQNHISQTTDVLWGHSPQYFCMLLIGTAMVSALSAAVAILMTELHWRGQTLSRRRA